MASPKDKFSSTILGLDVSATCTGATLVTVTGDVIDDVSWAEFKAPKDMRGAERCDWHLGKVMDFVPTRGADLVVIEGYGFSSHRIVPQVEVGAVLRYFMWSTWEGCRIVEVPPTVLKKFVTGRGNAKKEQVAVGVFKRYAFEHHSQDVVEAFALAMMGLAFWGIEFTNVAQRTIIDAVFKKNNLL